MSTPDLCLSLDLLEQDLGSKFVFALAAEMWACMYGKSVISENFVRPRFASLKAMFAILHALGIFVADLFKSRSRLEAENYFLRQACCS